MSTKEEWVAPYPVTWKEVIELHHAELIQDYPEDLWVDPAEVDYDSKEE